MILSWRDSRQEQSRPSERGLPCLSEADLPLDASLLQKLFQWKLSQCSGVVPQSAR